MKFSGLKGLVLGALALAASWVAPAPALAGSGCSTIVTGAVLTAAQWNACFAAKQNELGYTPVNKAGDSMTGLLTTVAPTTTTAGFRLNPGTAPTVPTNGDIWTTSAGLYVQVNGSTIGPITGGAAGSFAGTSPITVSFPSGIVTYAFDFSVANVFTARQTINLNGTTTPTPVTGTGLVVNPANATVGRVQVNAYGAIASFTGAIYAGTAAAPTQVLSGTQLTGINAYAYTGSALVGPIGSFRLYAAENITATAWGTKACVATVPLTTAVLTDSLCQQNSGGVTVGSPTGGDKGAGTINAAGTIYINGTALSTSAANLTVGTSTITSGTTTRVLYDNAGVLGEASALVTNGSSTVGVVSASFGLSGNISTTAWTTSGVRYKNVAATLTDTSSSGTVATAYTDVFGGNTIAASSATVFTNYFTHYVSAPTAGTNVTFTNSWALGADSAKIGTSNQLTISTAGVLTATSPVFTTPTLGVAAGTSLALGGATIGSNALGVTGNALITGSINVTANNRAIKVYAAVDTNFNSGAGLGSTTADILDIVAFSTGNTLHQLSLGLLRLGAPDAAVAVAQTVRVQSVVAGTAAASGANWTFIGSLPTGTGTSGDIIFQTGVKTGSGTTQGTATTALTIKGETQVLNAATGVAVAGCTIGTDKLCVTGTATISSTLTASAGLNVGATAGSPGAGQVYTMDGSSNLKASLIQNGGGEVEVSSTGAYLFHSGANIISGTADISLSRISAGVMGVGTGAHGSVAGTISVATIINAGITTDAAHTTSTVCQDTTTHQYYFGSGTAGICLGTSGRQFKTAFVPMVAGLDEIVKLKLWNYRYLAGYGDGGKRVQYGPTAQDVEAVIPNLVGHNENGEAINYDIGAFIPISLRAIQQLKADNDNLRVEVEKLKAAR